MMIRLCIQVLGSGNGSLTRFCYPIRFAYGFWKQTGDTQPFDATWHEALRVIVRTMREQQRKHDDGPYRFANQSFPMGAENERGFGSPMRPVGLIASRFGPSDDGCIYQFLIPSNLFAVTTLGMVVEMANSVLHDSSLANDAHKLAIEVSVALKRYGIAKIDAGSIWAYKVDGFGKQLLMDDSNVPSLLGLPYLESSPDSALYVRTITYVWSEQNPWFFHGSAGESIGGSHIGKDMIWPMSQIMYAQTNKSNMEIRRSIAMLKASAAGTGFMHESYNKNDVANFTRSWFAWANALFGEFIAKTAVQTPALLER